MHIFTPMQWVWSWGRQMYCGWGGITSLTQHSVLSHTVFCAIPSMLGHLWMCHWPDHRGKTLQRISLQLSFCEVLYYTAMDMNKQQEVEKICREVFEDTVEYACWENSQPSNQPDRHSSNSYSDVMIHIYLYHTIYKYRLHIKMSRKKWITCCSDPLKTRLDYSAEV